MNGNKAVVTTDKNSQDGKATNRKQQSVNGLPTTKNPDRIKQLESCPPKNNWHLFDSMDIRATEIIQTWKQVNTGSHISIRNFCPWGDDNYC